MELYYDVKVRQNVYIYHETFNIFEVPELIHPELVLQTLSNNLCIGFHQVVRNIPAC